MPVMFKTQQGRTLYREDLTAEDITRACAGLIEVIGYERGNSSRTAFHVHTRHIVEWWDDDTTTRLDDEALDELVAFIDEDTA